MFVITILTELPAVYQHGSHHVRFHVRSNCLDKAEQCVGCVRTPHIRPCRKMKLLHSMRFLTLLLEACAMTIYIHSDTYHHNIMRLIVLYR